MSADHPLVSFVVLPPTAGGGAAGDPAAGHPAGGDLAGTIASLTASSSADWELLTPDPAAGAAGDPRVRTVDAAGGVAAALAAARGTFVAGLEAGDTVAKPAPGELAAAARDGVDCIYSDEDGPGPAGGVVPKPDWSPELLRHQDYLGRLCALRTAVVRDVGGLDEAAGPALEYDLALKVTERGGGVVHLPRVLFHRARPRAASAEADAAARVAAAAHLHRIGLPARVVPGPVAGSHRLERDLDPAVTVSIVMPTRWQYGEVWGKRRCFPVEAVRTLLAATRHPAVEVVVVYDEPVPDGALEQLRELTGDRLVAVRYDRPFNFSEKCNLGVLHAGGEVVVLANDDIQPRSPGWLESLVAPLAEPGVGLTGAKLLYEDGTIQHGGHLHARYPTEPHPRLAYRYAAGDDAGPFNSLVVNRETSGVTAACLAITRATFEQVGGLTEDLPVHFNDVDLSLKVQRLGRRVLWLAEPVLFHFESQSREPGVHQFERDFIYRRWGGFDRDPYLPWLTS